LFKCKAFSSKVHRNTETVILEFFCFSPCRVGFWKRRNIFPQPIWPIQPCMHVQVCPCSWAVGISKEIWIQTYFVCFVLCPNIGKLLRSRGCLVSTDLGSQLVTVDSMECFHNSPFGRHGTRLACQLFSCT